MAVQERTRETGIMMAIGWSDRRIMAAIVLGRRDRRASPAASSACRSASSPARFFNLLPTIGAYLTFRPSLDTIAPSVAGALAAVGAGLALSGMARGFDDAGRRAAPRLNACDAMSQVGLEMAGVGAHA